jgi:hypothetical protein
VADQPPRQRHQFEQLTGRPDQLCEPDAK